MSTVATSSQDGPDEKSKQTSLQFISSAEMLRAKSGVCMAIMGQCMPMALSETSDFESIALKAKYEGGCSDAAQVTYIKACERLDKLLDNDAHWEIATMDKLTEERTVELHKINLSVANERLAREKYFNRPSIRSQAHLFRRGNLFYAVIGEDFTDESVHGSGDTPEAAFTNLDAILISLNPPKTP